MYSSRQVEQEKTFRGWNASGMRAGHKKTPGSFEPGVSCFQVFFTEGLGRI
jgi:hypothetical protein